jgi:hypothetical protein
VAPQPLTKVKADNWIFGTDGLVRRPEEAALVTYAIAGWSATEAHLGHIFGVLVGAKQPVAMRMYAEMRSFEVQRTLLETAAKELLPARYSDMFLAVLRILKAAAAIRHKFAHGIWGSSQDLPGALLLAEPRCFWHMRVARDRYWKRIKDVTGPALLKQPQVDRSLIYVYTTRDLKEACEKTEISYRYAQLAYEMISSAGPRRRKIYSLLHTSPEIRSALLKQTENHRHAPKAREKSPRKAPL